MSGISGGRSAGGGGGGPSSLPVSNVDMAGCTLMSSGSDEGDDGGVLWFPMADVITLQITETDLLAGANQYFTVTHFGLDFFVEMNAVVQKTVTTGGTIKLRMDVFGDLATVTIPDGATAGTVVTNAISGPPWQTGINGANLWLELAGFATAGAVTVFLCMLSGFEG